MTEELKHHVTKGVAVIAKTQSAMGNFRVETIGRVIARTVNAGRSTCSIIQEKADAHLIAEAFTVFSETGMTPREMQENIRVLESLLKSCGYYTDSSV